MIVSSSPSPKNGSVQTGRSLGPYTLGSDEVESTYIPDPNGPPTPAEKTAIRYRTLWCDGFSVEDGELRQYDDPAQVQILSEINTGCAPPSILNVLPG